MKKIITFLIVLFTLQLPFAQTTFKSEDLNGEWLSTKPGAELILDFQSTLATIISLEKTSLTKGLIGGNMYEGMVYDGNGVWKAQRNSWIYNGVGGNNSDTGHWEKDPILTLKLSKDKNTLSASGHWSYKRVNRVIEDNTSENKSKIVLIENLAYGQKLNDNESKGVFDLIFGAGTSSGIQIEEQDRQKAEMFLKELIRKSCQMSLAEGLLESTYSFNPSISGIAKSIISKY